MKRFLSAFSLILLSSACVHQTAALPVKRVLSLDGGGMLGIMEAILLEKIEKETGKPTAEIFDYIGGVSTGGLLALGLTLDGGNKRPKFSAAELKQFYRKAGPKIFTPASKWTPEIGKDPFTGKNNAFDGDIFSALLQKNFGQARMKDALAPTLVTAHNFATQRGIKLSSEQAQADPKGQDLLIWEAARATASPPGAFKPSCVHYETRELCNLVDGGVDGYDPTLLTYLAAKEKFPDSIIEIYSIGAGWPAASWVGQKSAYYSRLNVRLPKERLNSLNFESEQLDFLEQAAIKYTESTEFQLAIKKLKRK